MKMTISRYLLIALIALLLVPSVLSRDTVEINECKQSGWISGTTYLLNKDLGPVDVDASANGKNCMVIDAPNVILDCQGNSITGTNKQNSRGVVMGKVEGITTQNCEISDFWQGIVISSGSTGSTKDNTIVQNFIHDNNFGIIVVGNSDQNLIRDNEITSNGRGIQFYSNSDNNVVRNNVVTESGSYDVAFFCALAPCLGTNGKGNIFDTIYVEPGSTVGDWPVLGVDYFTSTDSDGDGVDNVNDNCPLDSNANQANMDGDTEGDVCDTNNTDGPLGDSDLDSIKNNVDNCPAVANTNQLDNDSDGSGNVCDTDDDNDSVLDTTDNCPLIANLNQINIDGDALGDACDTNNTDGPLGDSDSDTIKNNVDNCPLVANTDQADLDADGIGNVCDTVDNTPLNPEEQDLQDLENEFKELEKDFDDAEDDYRDARNDDDEDDIDNAKEDLNDIRDDLEDLENDLDDVEEDIDDNDELENQDELQERVDDLRDELENLQDDVEGLLGSRNNDDDFPAEAYELAPPSTPGKTKKETPPQVVISIPESVPATTETSDWEEVRPFAWAMAGVIVLLALVVFATGVLAIKMKKGKK